VLHGYVTFYPAVPFWDGVNLLVFYLAAILVTVFISILFFRQTRKAALIGFFIFFFQLFFGVLHDAIKSVSLLHFISRYTVIVPLILILLIAFAVFLEKSTSTFAKLVHYINVLFVIWITIDMVTLVYKELSKPKTITDSDNKSAVCATCPKPDVYLIIADEYAGAGTLNDVFRFDNSSFENSLKGRGFHVVESSVSNYNATNFSIASILNMDYLQGTTTVRNDPQNNGILFSLLNRNKVVGMFETQGYRFINYSIFDMDDKPTTVNNSTFRIREKLITGQTFTERFRRDVEFNFILRYKIPQLIKRRLYQVWRNNTTLLEKLEAETSKRAEHPRFIYTHFIMPHYPYYFRENGQPNPVATIDEGSEVQQDLYIEYLKFCNKKLLTLIDLILRQSKKPPIIVLMGDHGFRHFVQPTDSKYQFLNFNAVYLPDRNYGAFYRGMSGVNQFRVVLNAQFNLQLPLLKDSTTFIVQ
jgi:hypothetical protein